MHGRTLRRVAGVVSAGALSAACTGASQPRSVTHPTVTGSSSVAVAVPTRSATPPPRRHAPVVARVTAHDLGESWHPGCPVGPAQLRAVRVHFWGFDRHGHDGVIVVNRAVVRAVQEAFRSMLHAHFPMHRVEPVSAYGASDNRSMRHDNTSAFNCRYAVANGPKHWSMHAYGEAIDLDPRENPYRLNGKILPRSGTPYADRSTAKAGMVLADGPVVAVFDRLGWGWGGRWSSTPDYQHFSTNGR